METNGNEDQSADAAKLTPTEAAQCFEFMRRVQLGGDESEVHAALKFKLRMIAENKAMPKPPEPPSGDPDLTVIEGLAGKEGG